VVLPEGERGGVLAVPGGFDASGRGGVEATGRGAKELGADRSGLEGRGGFDEGARGGLELEAGRGGAVTSLFGGVLGGLLAPVCDGALLAAEGADGDGTLLGRPCGVVLRRAAGVMLRGAAGVVLGRSCGVVLGRAGGVVLATGAAGSSP